MNQNRMKRALHQISMDEGGAASLNDINLPKPLQTNYWEGARFYPNPLGMLFADDGVGELISNQYIDEVGGRLFGLPFLTADQGIRTVPNLKFTTPNTQYLGSSEFQSHPTRAMQRLAYKTIVAPMGSIGGTFAQELAGFSYSLADKFTSPNDAEYARMQYGNFRNQNPFISTYVPTMNVEEHTS